MNTKDNRPLCTECDERLEALAKRSLISEDERTILRNPERVISSQLHVTRDSGKLESIPAFRIQHSTARGPGKGGIRFHQDVNAEEVSGLAFVMSLKTALLDLPYGGAKGGVQFNPKEYSEKEIEQIARAFVQRMHDVVGPHKDIPAPDVNTTPQIMGWMRDEYEQIAGESAPGFITGKAIDDGGSEGRSEATGAGAYMVLRSHMSTIERKPQDTTVAIQGFGNAGAELAKRLFENGYKVVAVSDSKGGIYKEDGLDIQVVAKQKLERKALSELDGIREITNEELLELDVDVLAPAALGDVITGENAENIKAGIILEVANQPVTPEADAILEKNKHTVLPDLLVNAGGVTVSYFEWYQNINDEKWSYEDVMEKLEEKMSAAYKETHDLAEKRNISYRDAGYVIAIKRIAGGK